MSIIQIMVTIIIVTIIVTVILGVASYAAYWLRRGRRPADPVEIDTSPRFFYRYLANGDQETAAAAEESDAGPIQIASPVPLGGPGVALTSGKEPGDGDSGR